METLGMEAVWKIEVLFHFSSFLTTFYVNCLRIRPKFGFKSEFKWNFIFYFFCAGQKFPGVHYSGWQGKRFLRHMVGHKFSSIVHKFLNKKQSHDLNHGSAYKIFLIFTFWCRSGDGPILESEAELSDEEFSEQSTIDKFIDDMGGEVIILNISQLLYVF